MYGVRAKNAAQADFFHRGGNSLRLVSPNQPMEAGDVQTEFFPRKMLGFTRLEQIEENMKAFELYKKWNDDIEKKCEEILGTTPEPDIDFRRWAPMPSRRSISV